jgi:hypothetical protein
MSENAPPSNARNATVNMAEGHDIERAPLHDVNGHRVSVPCSKAPEIKKVRGLVSRRTEKVQVGLERKT